MSQLLTAQIISGSDDPLRQSQYEDKQADSGGGKNESSTTRHRHHHHHRHTTTATSTATAGISVIGDYNDDEEDNNSDARIRRARTLGAGNETTAATSTSGWDATSTAQDVASGKKPRKSSTHAGGHSLGLCGEDSIGGMPSTSIRDGSNYASQR